MRLNDLDSKTNYAQFNIDYTNPIDENTKIEMGFESRIQDGQNNFYNESLNFYGTNPFTFNRNIHAFYTNYSKSFGKFSAQVGVRIEEYTLKAKFERNEKNPNYFESTSVADEIFTAYPSAYLSYKLDDCNCKNDKTTAPLINQVLGWNGTNWIPVNQNSATPQVSLDDITNVNLTVAPEIDDVLTYDGTNWVALPAGSTAPTTPAFSDLTDIFKTADMIAYPAITRLNVTASGSSGYLFTNQYNNTVNPTIYAISGTTIAFNLDVPGHPFLIQTTGGANSNLGLIHVDIDGTEGIGGAAQGKTSGTVYWQIPVNVTGNYKYQCAAHTVMNGIITIKDISAI